MESVKQASKRKGRIEIRPWEEHFLPYAFGATLF